MRRYLYEEPLFPRHLTGIIDERGLRIRTYTYDLSGRVASSEGADIGHGVGLRRYSFDYGDGGMTTVTDTRGGRDQRWFDIIKGYSVVTRGRSDDARGASEAPSWAPDGRHLVFSSQDRQGYALWILDTVTGRSRVLTSGRRDGLPDWSPPLPPGS